MRQIVVTAFVSLDGVMEAPGGEPTHRSTGWTYRDLAPDPAVYELKEREQAEASAMLMGRVSYEAFAPVWPTMQEFTGYNAMPRYVVSTTLGSDDERWPATILRSLDDVAALRDGDGDADGDGDGGPIIVHGSATLGRALADAGLVDRYHLLVFPVLLGAGKQLFSDTDRDKTMLDVAEAQTYANGVQKLVYDVRR